MDGYHEDHDDDDLDYIDQYDDESDSSDPEDQDIIFRCDCKWKGGTPCDAIYEDENAMFEHLQFVHGTKKWIVRTYVHKT